MKTTHEAIAQVQRIATTLNANFTRSQNEDDWLIGCTMLWNAIDSADSRHCDTLWDLMVCVLPHFFRQIESFDYCANDLPHAEAMQINSVPFTYRERVAA